MVSRETASTPRQVFGAMLRYYRERAGLSRTDLARQISKSVSLIQAIELGHRAATADVTEDLERVLPSDGALTRLRDEIGDGLGYQAYPSWFQDWLVSERRVEEAPLVRAVAGAGPAPDRGLRAGHFPGPLRR